MERNKTEVKRDSRGLFVKGTAPGPGRKPGKTLKEYARDFLSCMTDEERQEFMDGLPKETIWKMAEGNPHSTTDLEVEVKPKPLLDALRNNSSNEED